MISPARFWFALIPSIAFFLCGVKPALAESSDAGMEFFEKKIRPVLNEHCFRCHSPAKRIRGGLDLSTKKGLLKGGDTGAAIVPGKPSASLMIKAISYADDDLQMPPKGKLPDSIVADVKKWIAMGAPDPRTGAGTIAKGSIDWIAARQFWAFQPIRKPPLPAVKRKDWAITPIDRFLLAQMEQEGFRPVADADRVTLIRRLYFTLIGLPPTPQQIQAFLKDDSHDAVERVVDGLLQSARFGERWGRHWLDVARFAESTGGGRSLLLKDAWRYRDYVVRSFNSDKPFDQFVREQVAGDLLPAKSWQQKREQLIATTYLALGPTNYELQDKTVLEMDVIDEQLDVIGKGLLGMTIACARCHDHKFDPIPHSDYYALAGIFRSTKTLIHDNVSQWVERPLPLPPAEEAEHQRRDKEIAQLTKQIKSLKKKTGTTKGTALAVKDVPGIVVDDTQAKRVGTWLKSKYMNHYIGKGYLYDSRSANEKKSLTFVPKLTKAGRYEVRLAYLNGTNRSSKSKIVVRHAKGEATILVNQKKPAPIGDRFISLGAYELAADGRCAVIVSNEGATDGHVVADAVQFLSEGLAKHPTPKPTKPQSAAQQTKQLKELEKKLKQLKSRGATRPITMSVEEAGKIADCPICIRGNVHSPGKLVPRGFLTIATSESSPKIPKGDSGRRQLAEWIASGDNPLTARVIVNRTWHHLFGCGLARTVDNFGARGEKPSHPELLDYLAATFIEDGWLMKKLIRRMVLTRAFQLSSAAEVTEQQQRDAQNRLLWRMNRRRLEAEAIRDAMLSVSGQLDLTMGGPTIKPGTSIEYNYKFGDTRRSLCTPLFRNVLYPMYEVFDVADPNLVTGKRTVSTTATQALFLMNNSFVSEQARHAAKAALAQANLDDGKRIVQAYWKTLGRSPTRREQELAAKHLTSSRDELEGWTELYHVLFASIDFRYVR